MIEILPPVIVGLWLALALWVAFQEWRLHTLETSMLTVLDAIKTQSDMLKTTNNKTESHALQIEALINAINGKGNDIYLVVQALNKLSYEVNQSEILQYEQKHTIQ
jgi:hypothetical protein